MATTTNFGWETPDDTDLVKDGAAAIRTALGGVDTSFVDLKGGTTGQLLSKASNTDLDYTWVSPNPGDITAVTAGTGISGGGTSGDVTITNSMATAITTNGDFIYGTGSGTFTRRGIGSTGDVLTVSGGVPTWVAPASGSMTSIASGSLSGSSLSLTSISGSYKNLKLVLRNVSYTGLTDIRIQTNTATQYAYFLAVAQNSATQNLGAAAGSGILLNNDRPDASQTGSTIVVDVADYANTSANKSIVGANYYASGSGANINTVFVQGFSRTTSAISTLTIALNLSSFAGGTYVLYGVN